MNRIALIAMMTIIFTGTTQMAEATIIVTSVLRDVVVGDPTNVYHGSSSPSTATSGSFMDTSSQIFTDSLHPSGQTAQADQDSNINAATGLFTGTGDAGLGFSLTAASGVYAKSIFDVTFTLSAAYDYSLSGSLAANVDGGRAESAFKMFDNSLNPIINFDVVDYGTSDLATSGSLNAGTYHLVVGSIFDNCQDSTTSAFDASDVCVPGQAGISTRTASSTWQSPPAATPCIPATGFYPRIHCWRRSARRAICATSDHRPR